MPTAVKSDTRRAILEDKFSPFSNWIRQNPALDSRRCRLDVQNLDYIIHGFGRDEIYLMLLEEKQYAGRQSDSQRETHSLIDQALRFASEARAPLRTMRGKKTLRHFGYHVVRFSQTNPEDSDCILWDGKPIDAKTLTLLLSFVIDPNTLQPLVDDETSSGDILSRRSEKEAENGTYYR